MMTSLDSYLKSNYQTAEQLALACNISVDELQDLVNEKLVPEPSYTVDENDTLTLQVFGEMPAEGAAAAQYFHPENAASIVLALETRNGSGSQQAHHDLKVRFRRNFIAALQELDKTIYRLADSFTDTGQPIPNGLDTRADAAILTARVRT